MTYDHYSPEWLAENCDQERAFEVAMRRHLLRLLDENRALKEQLESVGAGGVGPMMKPQDQRLQAQLDAANKACNELSAALADMKRQRDHWHARLTAEVLDRNKTPRGAA